MLTNCADCGQVSKISLAIDLFIKYDIIFKLAFSWRKVAVACI